MKPVTKLLNIAAATALVCFLSSSAEAVTITNPLSLTHDNVVGVLTGDSGNQSSDESDIAQAILDLSVGGSAAWPDGGTLLANTQDDFSGTITDEGTKDESGGTSIPAGFTYVLAKYDGPNGGYVLFFIGGEASTIPQEPWNLFGATSGGPSLALSHFTPFNSTTTPDGGATLGLLGLGMLGLGYLRRRQR